MNGESTPRCICGSFHPYPLTDDNIAVAYQSARQLIAFLSPAIHRLQQELAIGIGIPISVIDGLPFHEENADEVRASRQQLIRAGWQQRIAEFQQEMGITFRDADPYGVYPGHDDHVVEFSEKKLPERKGRSLIKPRSAITDILETETREEVRPVTNTLNESA